MVVFRALYAEEPRLMPTMLRQLGEWCTKHRAKLSFGLLLLLALKVYIGVATAIDLGLADETFSLGYGLRLPKFGPPPAQSSPLYSVWYYLLSCVEHDPIRLYPLNWFLLQLGLLGALCALSRRSGASLTGVLLVAVVWIHAHVTMVWPYVTYFSTLLLACAAIGATYIRDRLAGASLLSTALSICVFVRPELWTPALVVAVIVCGLHLRRAIRDRSTRFVPVAAAVAAAPVVGRLVFGDPSSGVRGLFALGQHYALNRVEDGKLPLDPWADWESLFRASFPRATTVSEAVRENPGAMLWHVTRNVRLLPHHLADLAPSELYVPKVEGVVFVLALIATLIVGVIGLVRARRSLPAGLLRWMPLGLVLLFVATTSSILIYPREHYLVPVCFFGLVLVAAGTGQLSVRLPPIARWIAPAFVLGALLVTPTYAPRLMPSILGAAATPPNQTAKHTSEVLRTLGVTGHVVTLESTWSRAIYAGLEFDTVWHAEKNAPFWSFIHARHIDIVIVDNFVRDNVRFRDDLEFSDFMIHPEHREDFVFFPVPGEDIILAVRKRVMRDQRPLRDSIE
jgi:hypothetical protein